VEAGSWFVLKSERATGRSEVGIWLVTLAIQKKQQKTACPPHRVICALHTHVYTYVRSFLELRTVAFLPVMVDLVNECDCLFLLRCPSIQGRYLLRLDTAV